MESRCSVESTDQSWVQLTDLFNGILEKEEALVAMGDFNRPLQAVKKSHGTKLLLDFLEEETMTLVNDLTVNTRIDPSSIQERALCWTFVFCQKILSLM